MLSRICTVSVVVARLTVSAIAVTAAALTAFAQGFSVLTGLRGFAVLSHIAGCVRWCSQLLQAVLVGLVVTVWCGSFATAATATAAFTTRWAGGFLTVGFQGLSAWCITASSVVGARFGASFGAVAGFAAAFATAIATTAFTTLGAAFCVAALCTAAFTSFTTLGAAFGVSAVWALGAFAATFATFSAIATTAFGSSFATAFAFVLTRQPLLGSATAGLALWMVVLGACLVPYWAATGVAVAGLVAGMAAAGQPRLRRRG